MDEGHHVVAAIEQYLEFLRNGGYSSNTVKTYSRALALWWTFLERKRLGWADVELRLFGEFLRELRMDSVETGVVSFDEPQMVPDGTVANRMRAVMSFYRYPASHGVTVASMLYEQVRAHPGPYLPFLEHVSRPNGRARARLRIRSPRSSTPILTPQQLGVLLDHEASWGEASVAGTIFLTRLVCPAPRTRHGFAAIRSSATAVFMIVRSSA